jgi:hypothetical protein
MKNPILFLVIVPVLVIIGFVFVLTTNQAIAPQNDITQKENSNPSSTKSINMSAKSDDTASGSILITVTQGDTLWSLAEQYLGDGSRWEEIYAFNIDNLESTWLSPNQTLEIIDCSKFVSHNTSEVQLLNPVGCEIWKRGTTYKISWIQKNIPGATKAHLFCYEENESGDVVYRGAVDYSLPSSSSDPNKPNTYKWDIPTSKTHSCPATGKKFMVEVAIANDHDERLGSARSGPLTILP